MNASLTPALPRNVLPLARHREVLPDVVGLSPVMRSLATRVHRVAGTSLPVLLRGETGTGKDLIARALHRLGPRHRAPFVAVNAATITDDLGASQLFGHAAGAFTGALTARAGAFRSADGGTLFLDELGSLPLTSQGKLLRVLEDGIVSPLGSDRSFAVDVRLVTATCEPLDRLVAEGRFRADLYQRLAVCVLQVPPLRERRGDIAPIAHALLAGSEFRQCVLSPDALEELERAELRGNVRELRNVLMHAAIESDDTTIDAGAIVRSLVARAGNLDLRPGLASEDARTLLDRCGGNVSLAARRAGLARSTFRDRLRGD